MSCGSSTSAPVIDQSRYRLPVPLAVLMHRRDICRQCHEATRNPERLERTTKGLTTKSVCRAEKRLHPERLCAIAVGTATPRARCPLGHWYALPA